MLDCLSNQLRWFDHPVFNIPSLRFRGFSFRLLSDAHLTFEDIDRCSISKDLIKKAMLQDSQELHAEARAQAQVVVHDGDEAEREREREREKLK